MHANPSGARFCNDCGQALDVGVPVEGERKRVTVLFADVKGSMGLSGSVDAEGWWDVMQRLFGLLCEGVNRFEGRVDRFTGDGVMAVFGAPLAQEDHARRACHAGLWLRDRLHEREKELPPELSVRIGLNSGEVVVGTIGEGGSVEYTAIGHTAGLAQRMESLAEPGRVYLTESTARLVEGFFLIEDRGAMPVKGVPAPIRVFELVGFGEAQTAFERARSRGLSRFIGRDQELTELEAALSLALAGDGQVVGVRGEPGVGKSRLMHEFTERLRRDGIEVWAAHALAHTTSLPFAPVLELLRVYFGIASGDSDREARGKVSSRLEALHLDLGEDLVLLLDLLGIEAPAQLSDQIHPEARQRRLFAALNRLVAAHSAAAPGVILLEDLHWLDPGSGAFLENLVKGVRDTRTLVLTTYRPGYESPWFGESHVRELRLESLGHAESGELLATLLGKDASLDGLAELVRERTGGNPFFIEETIASLTESGTLVGRRGSFRLTQTVEEIEIPGTVEAVLAARIDRLAERDKRILRMAAVIGRQFSADLLASVTGIEAKELPGALQRLAETELVFPSGAHGEYQFKHALGQEVAYRSQLAKHRATAHKQVAAKIEELYPDRLDELSALIAHHWEQAGEKLAAARWHARAAEWAGFNDPLESRRHWHQVRALSEACPESEERDSLWLAASVGLLNLAWRLGVPEGYTLEEFGRETSAIYSEAEAFTRARGNVLARIQLLTMHAAVSGIMGALERGIEAGDAALELARQTGNRELEGVIHAGTSFYSFLAGRLREAEAGASEGLLLTGGDPSVGAGVMFACPVAFLRMMVAVCWLYGGRLDECIEELEAVAVFAEQHGDPETKGWALLWLVFATAFAGGDADRVLAHAQRFMELVTRTGSAWDISWSYIGMGLAHLVGERWDLASEALERGIALSRPRQTGALAEPLALLSLSRAALGRGEQDQAVEMAERAISLAAQRGTTLWEIQARLELARALIARDGIDAADSIENELTHALVLIAETDARTVKPHIYTELANLARLRGDQDLARQEMAEARRLLVEIGAPALAARVPVHVS